MILLPLGYAEILNVQLALKNFFLEGCEGFESLISESACILLLFYVILIPSSYHFIKVDVFLYQLQQ